MSEIEKMYENAEIKKKYCGWLDMGDLDCQMQYIICESLKEWEELVFSSRFGKTEEEPELKYPPFTAEKQIAILMFILNKFGDIGFQKMYSIRGNDENTRKDFIKCLCDCEHETWDSRPVDFYYQKGASGNNFEESLAGLINDLWQDLTEEEKQQVKGILE